MSQETLNSIVWYDGNFEGKMIDSLWKKGTFEGLMRNCVWYQGNFSNGVFINSVWHDGTFHNGTMKCSEWHNGTWKSGVCEDTRWRNGTWKSGHWVGGNFGNFLNGTWEDGVFDGGEFREKAVWKNGSFLRGIFKGIWEDGYWISGEWGYSAEWVRGYILDPFKKGNYGEESKWIDDKFVLSFLNPREYFEEKRGIAVTDFYTNSNTWKLYNYKKISTIKNNISNKLREPIESLNHEHADEIYSELLNISRNGV